MISIPCVNLSRKFPEILKTNNVGFLYKYSGSTLQYLQDRKEDKYRYNSDYLLKVFLVLPDRFISFKCS
jgi:hypothetical protein